MLHLTIKCEQSDFFFHAYTLAVTLNSDGAIFLFSGRELRASKCGCKLSQCMAGTKMINLGKSRQLMQCKHFHSEQKPQYNVKFFQWNLLTNRRKCNKPYTIQLIQRHKSEQLSFTYERNWVQFIHLDHNWKHFTQTGTAKCSKRSLKQLMVRNVLHRQQQQLDSLPVNQLVLWVLVVSWG